MRVRGRAIAGARAGTALQWRWFGVQRKDGRYQAVLSGGRRSQFVAAPTAAGRRRLRTRARPSRPRPGTRRRRCSSALRRPLRDHGAAAACCTLVARLCSAYSSASADSAAAPSQVRPLRAAWCWRAKRTPVGRRGRLDAPVGKHLSAGRAGNWRGGGACLAPRRLRPTRRLRRRTRRPRPSRRGRRTCPRSRPLLSASAAAAVTVAAYDMPCH